MVCKEASAEAGRPARRLRHYCAHKFCHKRQNFSRDLETFIIKREILKINQIRILELKNEIAETKNAINYKRA